MYLSQPICKPKRRLQAASGMGDQKCCKPGLMCLTELHSKVWVMAWAMPGSSQNYEWVFFPGALHSTTITNVAYAVASQLPVDSIYIFTLSFWKPCKKKVLHAKKYAAAWWLTESFGGHNQSGTLGDLAWHTPNCFHLEEIFRPEISLCKCCSLSQGRWNSFNVLLCPKSTAVKDGIQQMRKINHNYLYLHFALKEFKCKCRNISLKNEEAKEDKIT